jgi:L-fucose isomerase-like protein
MEEYVREIENTNRKDLEKTSKEWMECFNVMDNRDSCMDKYSAIYVALDSLLKKYHANSLTVDCAFLPSVELVPCVAASLLIDKGIAFGCEGDVSQLISMQLLSGASGNCATMGNLFENATHQDIEKNEVVINHDVLPPSMAKCGCKMNFRDFHETQKGSTLYADMPEEKVTIGGLSFDHELFWLSQGKVSWTEDTVHCRLSIGIKVDNPTAIMKHALGHHQVMTYGNCHESVNLALKFLEVSIKEL